MAVFIGTFENKVDKKGRVSVPAPFRQALAGQSFQGIVAFPSRRCSAVEGCGMDLMESMIAEQNPNELLTDATGAQPAGIFYDLQRLAFDGQGRIVLPEGYCAHSGISDRATFVGVGKLFQIWQPERLAAYRTSGGAR